MGDTPTTDTLKALLERATKGPWMARAELYALSPTIAQEVIDLREENERLREALSPFAAAADECEGAPGDMAIGDASYEVVTVAHCRAARALTRKE